MLTVSENGRSLRCLPGRVRIEINGLKNNPLLRDLIARRFGQIEGVTTVKACLVTGRVLLCYDENRVSFGKLYETVQALENQHEQVTKMEQEVAVARQSMVAETSSIFIPQPTHPPLPNGDRVPSEKKIPVPLIASVAGLGVIGIKQLLTGGASALAQNLPLFYLSGLVAIVSGYPSISRTIQRIMPVADQKFNPIFAGALILALLRENLPVLGTLSLIQYLNWKRECALRNGTLQTTRPESDTAVQRYCQTAEKRGFLLAAATLLLTRSPLVSLAVLLASNPRPAAMSEEYAWNQAALTAAEREYPLPENGSIEQMARTRLLLVEDTSLLFRIDPEAAIECVADGDDEAKIWCETAALLRKSDHPWKAEVIRNAEATGRTMRTAFYVEEEPQGVKGMINGTEFLIGEKHFIIKNHVDWKEYEQTSRQLEEEGYQIQFVAKQMARRKVCMGVLYRKTGNCTPEYYRLTDLCREHQMQLAVWKNSLRIDRQTLRKHGIRHGWLSCPEEWAIRRIARLRQRGEEVMLVSGNVSPFLPVRVPTVPIRQIGETGPVFQYSRRIGRMIQHHLAATKCWNLLGLLSIFFYGVSAVVINALSDAVMLLFLARSKWICEKGGPRSGASDETLPRAGFSQLAI
ncbi:HMA2 domain-containing protein [Effusibacillus dendaii]|uniref:HMA domain-containing protein n=1 Tax=Effusibacillus dendaii TaxID=2743772 RepID=A0A7I8DKE9_9BACL|nr:hypothetical protein [Effusibacillus dendaii]BCJ88381.1 hypothetical protein skT53_33660 [Effusibacillus dendaii]